MPELDDGAKAVLRDRRRASRIRRNEQEAVDVPIGLLRPLLAAAPDALRTQATEALGPRSVEALTELASAS